MLCKAETTMTSMVSLYLGMYINRQLRRDVGCLYDWGPVLQLTRSARDGYLLLQSRKPMQVTAA